MLKDKPYFILRIEAKDASIMAKVNGFPIIDKRNLNQLTTELPVNQMMRNGSNSISLVIMPTDGAFKKQSVSLSLYVEKDEEPDTRKLVSQVVFSAAEKQGGGTGISLSLPAMTLDSDDDFKKSNSGDVKIENAEIKPAKVFPGLLEVSQSIYLETNFPEWGYLSADTLDFPLNYQEYLDNIDKYNDNLIKPLYEFNREIFKLFQKKDIEGIADLTKERNSEMDSALYLNKGNYDKELREELSSDFSYKESILADFEMAEPTISDDRKLIKIGTKGMIYLTDKEKTVFSRYEMWFYRKDGKWHISR